MIPGPEFIFQEQESSSFREVPGSLRAVREIVKMFDNHLSVGWPQSHLQWEESEQELMASHGGKRQGPWWEEAGAWWEEAGATIRQKPWSQRQNSGSRWEEGWTRNTAMGISNLLLPQRSRGLTQIRCYSLGACLSHPYPWGSLGFLEPCDCPVTLGGTQGGFILLTTRATSLQSAWGAPEWCPWPFTWHGWGSAGGPGSPALTTQPLPLLPEDLGTKARRGLVQPSLLSYHPSPSSTIDRGRSEDLAGEEPAPPPTSYPAGASLGFKPWHLRSELPRPGLQLGSR